jgi:hypothetical protein
MWDPQHVTTLQVPTASYNEHFALLLPFTLIYKQAEVVTYSMAKDKLLINNNRVVHD